MARTADGHPRLRLLADLLDGLLEGARLARTSAHLDAGCSHCDARLARLRRTLAALASGPPEEPPAKAVRAAEGLLREAGLTGPWGVDALDAVLVLDAGTRTPAGVRSPAGSARRLLFRVGEHELDLAVVTRPGGFDLLGHFLGPDATASCEGDVAALRGRRRLARGAVRTDGRFTLRGLPQGFVALTGTVGGRRFRVRGVHLG